MSTIVLTLLSTLIVILFGCAIGFTANSAGYNDGYCTAKNGHYFGNGMCNVNGTLVPIP